MTTSSTTPSQRARMLPLQRRSSGAGTSWWRELGLLGAVYVVYLGARAQISLEPAAAREHGRQLLELEAALGLDVEHALNAALHAVPLAALVSAYLYASLHYLLTPAVLAWLAARHSDRYAQSRNVLVVATALGVIGFWLLPTAPPRLLGAGFLDTMALTSQAGWWGAAASAPRGLEGLSNQYAAMPSLHVGWAIWVALTVRQNSSVRRLASWAWTYPAITTLVVVATANHYVIDALAGAACVLVAHSLQTNGRWLRQSVPPVARRLSPSASICR